jgi:hypothetical protein
VVQEELLETGNLLVDTCKLMNESLGLILFTEVGLASFNLTLSCYFDCTVYSLFMFGFHPVVLAFITTNVVQFHKSFSPLQK